MKYLYLLCILNCALCLILFAGCSHNVPLGGRITFADNGEPLMEGTIAFVSGTNQARSEKINDIFNRRV